MCTRQLGDSIQIQSPSSNNIARLLLEMIVILLTFRLLLLPTSDFSLVDNILIKSDAYVTEIKNK
jgi:hypothetical protein